MAMVRMALSIVLASLLLFASGIPGAGPATVFGLGAGFLLLAAAAARSAWRLLTE